MSFGSSSATTWSSASSGSRSWPSPPSSSGGILAGPRTPSSAPSNPPPEVQPARKLAPQPLRYPKPWRYVVGTTDLWPLLFIHTDDVPLGVRSQSSLAPVQQHERVSPRVEHDGARSGCRTAPRPASRPPQLSA